MMGRVGVWLAACCAVPVVFASVAWMGGRGARVPSKARVAVEAPTPQRTPARWRVARGAATGTSALPPAVAATSGVLAFDVRRVLEHTHFHLLNANVAIGDVTGDGRNDLVVLVKAQYGAPNTVQDRVMLFRQDGLGQLQAPIEHANGATYNFPYQDMALGDLDRDGDLDIVVTHPGGLTTLAYRADGSFGYTASHSIYKPHGVRLVDIDRDGRLDAVTRGPQYGAAVHYGDGSGAFPKVEPTATVPGGTTFAAGDVTSDGLADLVASDTGQYRTAVIPHGQIAGGQPTYYGHEPSPRGVTEAAIGDFNRDGRHDIAVAIGMEDGPILHLRHQDATRTLGPGSRIALPVTDLSYDTPVGLAANDIDGDGLDDLLMLYGQQPMRLGVLRQGAAGFEPLRTFDGIGPSGHGARPLAVGDLDGDGCRDVVALAAKEIVLFRNAGCLRAPDAAICRTQLPVAASAAAAPAVMGGRAQ